MDSVYVATERQFTIHRQYPYTSEPRDVLKCHECCGQQVSVRRPLWVDFHEDGRREVDEQELLEFEVESGDEVLCRSCGFTWIYGHVA